MLNEIVVATNPQKVLDFIIREPIKQFTANEIQAGTKISKAGINTTLRKLADEKLIIREKKAKIYLYSVKTTNQPLIKQLKVMQNLLILQPLVNKLKTVCEKIILYGSCARGEDTSASDIDLLIISNALDDAGKIAGRIGLKKKVQLVFKSPLAFVEMEKKDREYFEELSRGLVLWEANK
ncbi:nucleotidyltransferase domain-containing protein [bacterium]|nr:nucleotidyltransferase domain-containing protein [bacterium]